VIFLRPARYLFHGFYWRRALAAWWLPYWYSIGLWFEERRKK